eukprot:TRINITY_DN2734_c1_g2_i14.p2 TRINITY_DN2734_c1_g2~~TRINITY_DN2734_c1_g2_i14.p2  ORF type:complete len:327 (-),score=29.72 TRINITY_DN2734_c1_g2_i14:282-1262(-)
MYAPFMGLACDAIVSVTMVLGNGTIIEVSETANPDLFEGVRGAGSVFGVVTELTLSLTDITGLGHDLFIYPYSEQTLENCLKFQSDIGSQYEGDVGITVNLWVKGPAQVIEVDIAHNNYNFTRQILLTSLKHATGSIQPIEELYGQNPYDMFSLPNSLIQFFDFDVNNIGVLWMEQGVNFGAFDNTTTIKQFARLQAYEPIATNISYMIYFFIQLGGKVRSSQCWTGMHEYDVIATPVYQYSLDKNDEFMKSQASKMRAFNEKIDGIQSDIYVNQNIFPNDFDSLNYSTLLGGDDRLLKLNSLKCKYDPDNVFTQHYYVGAISECF